MEERKEKLYVKVNDESLEGRIVDYLTCNISFKPFKVSIHLGEKLLKGVLNLVRRTRIR